MSSMKFSIKRGYKWVKKIDEFQGEGRVACSITLLQGVS